MSREITTARVRTMLERAEPDDNGMLPIAARRELDRSATEIAHAYLGAMRRAEKAEQELARRAGWRTADWLQEALRLYVERGSPADPTLGTCPGGDLLAIIDEIGVPADQARAERERDAMQERAERAERELVLTRDALQGAGALASEPTDACKSARYVALICEAYLAAPEYSDDEEMLERVLSIACERLGLEPDEALQRHVDESKAAHPPAAVERIEPARAPSGIEVHDDDGEVG